MFHSQFDGPGRRPAARLAASLAAGAALAVAAGTAHAQAAAPVARPDPLDPKVTVPAPVYESSFVHYRRLSDAKPIPWREANDTATAIGGWRTYLREAQQPEPASAPKPAPVRP
jgi:hypothetical protein